MKILFALNQDIFSVIALNLMRPFLDPLIEAKGVSFSVVTTGQIGKKDHVSPLLELMAAEKTFPYEGLFPLVDTLMADAFGADIPKEAKFLTPKGFEKRYGVVFEPLASVNTPRGHELVSDHDVTLSIRFGSIFKEAAIACSRLGIINVHSAPLPAYRGILGVFQALRRGEKTLGGTIHTITDSTIDTGETLAHAPFEYEEGVSLFGHIRRLYEKVIPVLGNILTDLAHGKPLPPPVQKSPHQEETYYTLPTSDQVKEFKQRKISVVTEGDIQSILRDFMPSAPL
jgi:hypothetical protein